jgi:hypothetical protein
MYFFSADLIKTITLNRQSTFVRYHTSEPWSRSRFVVWLVCFFQQFYIPRADYLALRLSFIYVSISYHSPNQFLHQHHFA